MPNVLASAVIALPLALAAFAPAGSDTASGPAPRVMVNLGLQPNRVADLRRSPDGLFYVTALVNDVPVRFLVDTGANAVVLTTGDAQRAGIARGPKARSELAQTAGGQVEMTRIRLRSLEAGPLRRDNVEVAVADSNLSVSLLGQSWLSQLGSVTIAGDRMVLQ